MIDEELIRQITREVLKQLRLGDASDPGSHPERTRGPKVLLLYTGGDQNLDEAVAVAGELRAAGAQVRVLCTPSARTVLGAARLEKLSAAGQMVNEPSEEEIYEAVFWADAVAVPVLTQNTAAKWALGIRDSPATNLLAAALLMNRRIVVCPDSAVPNTANLPYRSMLLGHIERLRTFGVLTVPIGDMVRACLSQAGTQVAPPAPASGSAPAPPLSAVSEPAPGPAAPAAWMAAPAWAAGAGASSGVEPPSAPLRLVTAADVEAAVKRGARSVLVAARAIVTPLARDLCRHHGVALVGPDGGDTHATG